MASKEYQTFLEEHLADAQILIGHTRWATKGSPFENENNHPLYTDNCAVVHNGCISNDDQLFKELKIPRHAEVDSDILRAIVDHEGLTQSGVRMLTRVRGSVAAAMMSRHAPGQLLLVRSESPLIVGATRDMVMWASTKNALHLAARQWEERFGMYAKANTADLMFVPVPNHTAWLFNEKGREWYQEFKTAMYQRTDPTYASLHDAYDWRRTKWNKTEDKKEGKGYKPPEKSFRVDFVICKNPKCLTNGKPTVIEIPTSMHARPLHTLRCRACKTPLDTEPEAA